MDFNEYQYKTELHAHTNPASGCSKVPPSDMVENYAKLGYDSIVICNHFTPDMRLVEDKEKCIAAYLDDFYKAAEAGEKFGINVIFGCEIRFPENMNDYLLFGIEPGFLDEAYEYLKTSYIEFSKFFRDGKRLFFQAHPFRDNMVVADPQYLDGVETFNAHPYHNSRVAVAAKFAHEHDLIVSVGTDCHEYEHKGLSALLTKTELKNSTDVAEALKSRDYIFDFGGSIVLPY